jgi:hypothetical protein
MAFGLGNATRLGLRGYQFAGRAARPLLHRPQARKVEASALRLDVRPIESAIRRRLNSLERALAAEPMRRVAAAGIRASSLPRYDFRFNRLAEMVKAHQQERRS